MRVTVAMATYNGERFVETQLRSILDQLGTDDEIVVVDDDSTDDTVERLRSLTDPRIRLYRNQRNEGVLCTFERALRMSRGDIVFLADQDDVWLPGKRDALCSALSPPTVAVAISDAQVIDAEGNVLAPSFMGLRGGFRAGLAATLLKNRYLGCAMALKRRVLDVALPIPPDVPMHDMWLGAVSSLVGTTAYVDRPLMQYRRHSANVSPASRAGVSQMVVWRWRLARNVVLRTRAWRAARPAT